MPVSFLLGKGFLLTRCYVTTVTTISTVLCIICLEYLDSFALIHVYRKLYSLTNETPSPLKNDGIFEEQVNLTTFSHAVCSVTCIMNIMFVR